MSQASSIIGIDVGFGRTKTAHFDFASSVKRLPVSPSVSSRTIEYKGAYYAIGASKTGIQKIKTETEDMLILTMAGIAMELERSGTRTADIHLGVGTPLTRLGAEKKDFIEYYNKARDLEFRYEETYFNVNLKTIEVFPQGYSGIVPRMKEINCKSFVLADIGSFTVDILFIEGGTPDMTRAKSLPLGLITQIQDINEVLRQRFGFGVDETYISDVIQGSTPEIPDEYLQVIKSSLREYATSIIEQLRALGVNPQINKLVFIGGGASLMQNFLDDRENVNHLVIPDIHINAIGYEALIRRRLGM